MDVIYGSTPRKKSQQIINSKFIQNINSKFILVIPVYVTVDRYFTHETTANLSTMPTSEAPAFVAFTACTMRDQAYKVFHQIADLGLVDLDL